MKGSHILGDPPWPGVQSKSYDPRFVPSDDDEDKGYRRVEPASVSKEEKGPYTSIRAVPIKVIQKKPSYSVRFSTVQSLYHISKIKSVGPDQGTCNEYMTAINVRL
jgi:hypothetical protein